MGSSVTAPPSETSLWLEVPVTRSTAFGEATHYFGAAASEGTGRVVQPDGRIVATGYGSADTTTDAMHLSVRFGTDGRWDMAYGATLLPSTGPRSIWYQSHASAVQPDGRIVSVGQRQDVSTAALPTDFARARLDADGTPDERFPGVSAVATFDLGTTTDIAHDVGIQQDTPR